MLDFQVPRISSESVDDNRGSFTIEPLDRGFGYTFGNSLRRVLLSSLAGAAVTSVRIEGVAHEFSTIRGVKEDVTDIVLNLKDLVVRMHTDADEVEAPLVATGPGEVKAKDIDLPSGVEILNPEAPIATLEKKTKLEVYLTIGRGRGYSPAEENKSDEQPIGVIPIDSIFSPIRRASYAVSGARVGQRTTLDVLNAQQELVNARVALVTAQHDRVVASYTLLAAVGGLSMQRLGLNVTIYDPQVHYQQVRDAWIGVRTPDGR